MFKNLYQALKSPVLLTAAFSLLISTGCKTSSLTGQDVSAPQTNAPQQAPPTQPSSPILADGSRTTYADIVERVTPAVVNVSTEQKSRPNQQQASPLDDFFRNLPLTPQGNQRQPRLERGLGSGVIISADGTILTNHHVIEGAEKIRIEMNDKRMFEAKVVGSDQPSDLAVLKIEAQNLPYLNLGNSDQVRVGDVVLAIGNPLGIGQTVTAGIISAKGRRTGLSDGSFEDFLQTDAPINRGNSGGALVNLAGELIGINSQILSTTGGSIGIGFSIPSNMAKPVMEQILKEGKVRRGQLGVVIQPITEELAKTLELKDTRGVIVSEVRKGSAAERAALQRGDVIIAINGEKIDDANVLRNKVAGTLPGNEISITFLRETSEQTITTTVDEFKPETSGNNSPEEGNNDNSAQPEQSGRIGLDLQSVTPEIATRLGISNDLKGLVVMDVEQSGPGAEAGIVKGDVILEINRQPVQTVEQAKSALDKAGDRASLFLITRGGRTIFLTVQPTR